MTPLRFKIFLLAMFLVSLSHAADDNEKAAPLFSSNNLLEVTIRGPFSNIMRERSREKDEPGTLTYNDPEAGDVTVELGIRTRGRFRHQSEICPWAPLRLNFKKSSVKGTLFAGSNKLKLVTHCRNSSKQYTQGLLTEHLAYRIFNQVTDDSFRVRLLRVTYVDTSKDDRERTEFAFLIEHRKQVAKRIGVAVNSVESVRISQLDPAQINLVSVFQYLIANTDFSPVKAAPGEPCCHNNVLFGDQDGDILAVPYDFDMAGIVDAEYAVPNPRFRLRDVRQRLYRGRCVNNEYLGASTQAFIDQKQAIFDLIDNNEHFDRGTRRQATRFIDEFYKTIENPKKMQSSLVMRCL
jgi:hypothetical protein